MAQATERSQMVAMRTNFIQKCGRADFQATLDVCNPEHITGYVAKMADNYNVLRHLHQGLYLVRGCLGVRGVEGGEWCCLPMRNETGCGKRGGLTTTTCCGTCTRGYTW
jgi:hypothetical protein